jgi:macrolide transport system ATP-binding/permease protein
MSKHSLQFHCVTFFYETSSDPILDNVSAQISSGWTGIIGGNGAGKTTFLRLACGQLKPTLGNVVIPQNTIYCDQRTDDNPDKLSSFLQSSDAFACKLRGQLGLESDWVSRWHTLSHGERKRAQIAIAYGKAPRSWLLTNRPTTLTCRHAKY